ncbi:divergent PAP2 family protein [Scopulibacillus cellulosilyticus]|uniref:Divergent PAP2 family protein n=1 Tax=Scopulibacillus cellulosilyticus TaxID=2665665 RepID=A0ABW2PZ16_9BACL
MALFENFPLIISLLGIFVAQVIKVPIHLIVSRRLNWGLLISNGGMPSSHSCAVTALATGVGLESGFRSTVFAVAAMFAIITMFDAAGVRRQAGEHASLLNQLRKDFATFVSEFRNWQDKSDYERQKDLKELLGHKPIEVYSGAVLGILLALIVFYYFW